MTSDPSPRSASLRDRVAEALAAVVTVGRADAEAVALHDPLYRMQQALTGPLQGVDPWDDLEPELRALATALLGSRHPASPVVREVVMAVAPHLLDGPGPDAEVLCRELGIPPGDDPVQALRLHVSDLRDARRAAEERARALETRLVVLVRTSSLGGFVAAVLASLCLVLALVVGGVLPVPSLGQPVQEDPSPDERPESREGSPTRRDGPPPRR